MLLKKLPPLQDTNDDDGSDLSGADRGDSFTPTGEADADPDKDEKEEKDESDESDEKDEKDEKDESDEKDEKDEKDETGERPRAKDGKFAPKMVPAARLSEVSKRARAELEAANARIAELEAATKSIEKAQDVQKLEGEISTLEEQLEAARADGNKERAAQLARDIRMKERQINLAESSNLSSRAREEAKEEMRWELTIESLEAKHPQLDPKSDDYDEELCEEVLMLQRGFQANGLKASAALLKAVSYVESKLAKPATPKEEDDSGKGLKKGKGETDDRKKKQVEKNLDASRRQPANLENAGLNSDKGGGGLKVNVQALTDEEWDALPESKKAQLRGDFVG